MGGWLIRPAPQQNGDRPSLICSLFARASPRRPSNVPMHARTLSLAIVPASSALESGRARGSDAGRSRRSMGISHASSIRSGLGDRPRLESQTPCVRREGVRVDLLPGPGKHCAPQGFAGARRRDSRSEDAPAWCVRIGRTESGQETQTSKSPGRYRTPAAVRTRCISDQDAWLQATADGTLYGLDERVRDGRLTKVAMGCPVPAAGYV
ncbi:hypothetical protein C2E23DRAFT_93471 [Lenzites betulinus]|nr:hypothetical protein C2E23DRAFT_93471 [Lenzites betulinus]